MHDNGLISTHMLEAARQNKVKRLLFSSSARIYPTYKQTSPDLTGLREEDAYPADPDNFYGWEKLHNEKLCEAYQRDHGMDIRVLRYHNIYAPEGTDQGGRQNSPAALCRKVSEASNPGVVIIWGDGKQSRSYCYIDDCVKGTIALMESDFDKPINIGSERLVTINKLADIIIGISGKKIVKKYDLSAPQGVRGRNADIHLARKVLKWEPKVSLEQGLAETYRWITERCVLDQKAA
jgi:GDP-D-mannose 3',5'-epimerase